MQCLLKTRGKARCKQNKTQHDGRRGTGGGLRAAGGGNGRIAGGSGEKSEGRRRLISDAMSLTLAVNTLYTA